MATSISLRPITPGDDDFLCRVYGSSRADELALVAWDESQKAVFVRQQFDAQHRYYQQQYTNSSFLVVLVDGQPAGRLYLARWPGETRIVDIAVLPEFRGRGVGSELLGDVLAGAAAEGRCVTIHVERNNPARRWYERLGFEVVAEGPVYDLMRWQPPASTGQQGQAASTATAEPR